MFGVLCREDMVEERPLVEVAIHTIGFCSVEELSELKHVIGIA